MKLGLIRRRTVWVVLAALGVVLAYASLAYLHPESKATIKIGVLHSLTGPMAASEMPLVDAVRLAVEETNQSGGVNGARLEMVVEDCRSDAAWCANRAEKLITEDKAQALFGCWTSACRKAVKPVVERHRHLLFYPVQYEGLETSPAIVYTGATPSQQLIPMVSWAMQQRGKRVYMVGSDYVYPHTANAIARKLVQAHNGQVAGEYYIPLGGREFRAIAQDIAARRPDFVLNTLNGDSNIYFFRALRDAGVRAAEIPVFSTSIAEVELAAIGAESVAGNYTAWSYFQGVDSKDNRDFIARFRARFGADRVLDDPMESAYIAVKLWVQVARSSARTDPASIRANLPGETLRAPEGIVAVDGDTMHLWRPVRIGRGRADGQFDIAWQSQYSIAPAPYPFFIPHAELAELAKGAP